MATIHADTALLPDGWHDNVRVELDKDGRISRVTEAFNVGPAETHVSCLLPAPVNSHSHAFQRAMAGLTEHPAIIHRTVSGPGANCVSVSGQLTPDHVESITALVQMEMLKQATLPMSNSLSASRTSSMIGAAKWLIESCPPLEPPELV